MKIHFVGIGGIGVSALAKYYLQHGDRVSGSDLASSEITEQLEKMGTEIFIGPHKSANLKLCPKPKSAPLPDLVVYSPAVSPNNPELKEAVKKGIPCQSYPRNLGEITKKYFTIAVCGTHGKGTTTALVSLILIEAKLDPTVIIGTKLKEFNNSNFRPGKSKYLIIEADEYKSSFLNYWPKIIVITCIDRDHLEYFKNLNNIVKTFRSFIKKLPSRENLIVNLDDKNSLKLMPKRGYSLKQKEAEVLKKILKIPGNHIVADALAALALARSLGIKDKISFKALAKYKGAWRRFEQRTIKIKNKAVYLINDYAHHPKEIEVTLKAVKQKYPKQRIICVFQPHQYQRTFHLFKDFVKVFAQAQIDELILADIYSVSGRESQAIKKKVNSKKLASAISKKQNIGAKTQKIKIRHISTSKKIALCLKKNIKNNDVLIIMGAGDIYELNSMLTNNQEKGKI